MVKACIESVFNAAAAGDAKGSLIGPGIEKVHRLLASSDEAVSVDDVRGVYEEQQWDENALLDLQQFTTLWAATIGDKDVVPVKVPEVSAAGEKINEISRKESCQRRNPCSVVLLLAMRKDGCPVQE